MKTFCVLLLFTLVSLFGCSANDRSVGWTYLGKTEREKSEVFDEILIVISQNFQPSCSCQTQDIL
jgi:hypothetical protein